MSITHVLFWLLVAVFIAICAAYDEAHSQGAQEQIERTIGSLVVQNAQCSSQAVTQNAEIARLRKELDDIKKTAAVPQPSSVPGNTHQGAR